jgi:hypothetical protein
MVFLTVFAGRFERASQAPAVPGAPVTGIELPVQANATTRNCMSANAHGANRQAAMPPMGFGAGDPCETLGFPRRNLPRVGSPSIDTARAKVCNAAMKRATDFNAALKRVTDFGGGIAAYDRGDYATAFGEMKPLAEQGDADSQNNLGVLYYLGQGVPQDYVQAHMWFNLSAAGLPPGKDLDSAAENRDIVAKLMTPAQIAEAQRRAREWKPK